MHDSASQLRTQAKNPGTPALYPGCTGSSKDTSERKEIVIYTVTLNPSLDYLFTVENFKLGMTNRTSSEELLPGGKGINVSIVLQRLGFPSTALGFVAGFTGEEIQRRLDCLGLATDFIRVPEGFSRINCKLKNEEGTEINGCGPKIGEKEVSALLKKLDALAGGDILFLSGSIPKSLSKDLYARILAQLEGRGILSVVDATGEALLAALPYHPFLIKPNLYELAELFGAVLSDRESAIPYARKLQERGATNVLVSLGGEGALLSAEDGSVLEAKAPRGKLVNAVGAGDSMAAGFMAGWLARRSYAHAFRMGLAAGSASAFSEHLASREKVEALLSQIEGEGKQQC